MRKWAHEALEGSASAAHRYLKAPEMQTSPEAADAASAGTGLCEPTEIADSKADFWARRWQRERSCRGAGLRALWWVGQQTGARAIRAGTRVVCGMVPLARRRSPCAPCFRG